MGKNPFIQFVKYWHKHGLKETLTQLKKNYLLLETPLSLINKEIYGYYGTIVGILLSFIMLLYYGYWYISIIMAFSLLIQYAQLVMKLKQKEMMVEAFKYETEFANTEQQQQ